MSFVQSTPPTARIRILGCDPAPPPRRRPSPRLVAAAVAVALAGVGAVLLLARPTDPQPIPPRAVPVAPTAEIGVMASHNPAAWRSTRALHRTVRLAATTDLAAAASVAQRRDAAARPPATSVAPPASTASAASSAAPASDPPPSYGSVQQPVVVGPELPPGPMNPGVSAP
jgi:hypothetical protein